MTKIAKTVTSRGRVARPPAPSALAPRDAEPAVKAARRCGPVLTPNHRLIPDVRWIMNLPADQVIARTDTASATRVHSGLAIVPARRSILLRQGFDPVDDSPQDTANVLPPAGYVRIAGTAYYAAYARCN